jgi:hypothetical protein
MRQRPGSEHSRTKVMLSGGGGQVSGVANEGDAALLA